MVTAYLPHTDLVDHVDTAAAANVNSVYRDLQTRGFNADGYGGLVGNGIADDTVALQAAITAAAAGGAVELPPGTYLITASLVMSNDGVTLRAQNPWTAKIITASRTIKALTISGNGCVVRDVWFDNQSALPATAGCALELTSGRSQLIDNCVFASGWYDNISVVDAYDVVISRNKIIDAIRAEVHYQSVSVPDRGDSWVIDNLIGTSGTTTYGLLWESGGGLRVTGNKFLEHDTAVMLAPVTGADTQNVFIQNNSIENVVSYGVRALRASGTPTVGFVHIQNNEFDCTAAGVVAAIAMNVGFQYPQISGNNIRTTAKHGVEVNAATGAFVQGNNIIGCSVGVVIGDGVNNRVGSNNFIACTINVQDATGYDAVYGPVEHYYQAHLHTTSNAAYTDLFDIKLLPFKGCWIEVVCDFEGADEGTYARRTSKVIKLPGSPGAVTVTNDADVGDTTAATLQFKTSTNDHVIIGAKKPSGSAAFVGSMTLRVIGSPASVAQL